VSASGNRDLIAAVDKDIMAVDKAAKTLDLKKPKKPKDPHQGSARCG